MPYIEKVFFSVNWGCGPHVLSTNNTLIGYSETPLATFYHFSYSTTKQRVKYFSRL